MKAMKTRGRIWEMEILEEEDKMKARKRSEIRKERGKRVLERLSQQGGMELVQVAILVAIAIVIGLIFRTQIQAFVDDVFTKLSSGKFS
jgi:hypothetical protein